MKCNFNLRCETVLVVVEYKLHNVIGLKVFVPFTQISNALEFLSNQGHIYATIDNGLEAADNS